MTTGFITQLCSLARLWAARPAAFMAAALAPQLQALAQLLKAR
jgi:hypothetical protein